MDFCEIVALLLIVGAIFGIYFAIKGKLAEREQKVDIKKTELANERDGFNEELKKFFDRKSSYISSKSYEDTAATLSSWIAKMQTTNQQLKSISKKHDYSGIISLHEQKRKRFLELGKRLEKIPFSMMIDVDNYGKVQRAYWDFVQNTSKEEADKVIETVQNNLKSQDYEALFSVNLESVLQAIWFYATERPYSAGSFNAAVSVYSHIAEKDHIDVIIAELYAMKQMAGEEVFRDKIRFLLKGGQSKERLALLASALMWMNAYQAENLVLQHMLNEGMEMSSKMQDRIHSLSTGGGNAPGAFNVTSSDEELFFDVSALAWKDKEYSGFFENLTFREQDLKYSLAVRDEDKGLALRQGISVPSTDEILHQLKEAFSKEYEDTVLAAKKKCIALSGNGKQSLDGILVTSKECRQMSILIHIVRIGRSINIKFYTLFMPTNAHISELQQQVLSLHKKLDPVVNVWESGLKNSILLAIQELLNSNPYEVTGGSRDEGDAPVF